MTDLLELVDKAEDEEQPTEFVRVIRDRSGQITGIERPAAPARPPTDPALLNIGKDLSKMGTELAEARYREGYREGTEIGGERFRDGFRAGVVAVAKSGAVEGRPSDEAIIAGLCAGLQLGYQTGFRHGREWEAVRPGEPAPDVLIRLEREEDGTITPRIEFTEADPAPEKTGKRKRGK